MTDEEKIRKCVELVWDYEENYEEEDLIDFQVKELSTYSQHNNIINKLNKYEQLEKENKIMKTILLDVFKKHGDLCSLCETKGQKLPECKCMKDNECLEHIIELYGGAK